MAIPFGTPDVKRAGLVCDVGRRCGLIAYTNVIGRVQASVKKEVKAENQRLPPLYPFNRIPTRRRKCRTWQQAPLRIKVNWPHSLHGSPS